MSTFNFSSAIPIRNSVSDIHICGQCRSEFDSICKFISHKELCGISKIEIGGTLTTTNTLTDDQSVPKFIDNIDSINISHTDQSNALPKDESYAKTASDNDSIHVCQIQQPTKSTCEEGIKNNIYIYSSVQQENVMHVPNLNYDAFIQSELIDKAQCQAVDPNNLVKQNQSMVEHCFDIYSFSQQELNPSSLDNNNSAIRATSQTLLNSAKSVVIPDSDNTVDSSALCPEDLEVGQISEAMIGKLSQKFCPKGPCLTNRKLNESSNKRIGRLDPISTFNLKRKGEGASNTNIDYARSSLPFNANRVTSSSAPIAEECENESTDGLNLKGISFEKRERLQGVSDEILDQIPSTTTAMQTENGVTSTQFQNVVESYGQHETSRIKNSRQQKSIYKAVFTSPSCGGHRLSVKIPKENRMGRYPCESTISQRGNMQNKSKGEELKKDDLEKKNTSTTTSYKNISNLTECSKNATGMPDTCRTEEGSSLVSNVNQSSSHEGDVSDVEKNTGCTKITMKNETVGVRECVNLNVSHHSDCSTLRIPVNDVHSYPICSIDTKDSGTTQNEILVPVPAPYGNIQRSSCSVTERKINGRDFVPTENMNAWEPEEIQVITTDQMKHMSLSGGDSNNYVVKREDIAVNCENYSVDGEDTLVFVYKKEDNSFIMMCKPRQSSILGDKIGGSLQTQSQSLVTNPHENLMDYLDNSITHRIKSDDQRSFDKNKEKEVVDGVNEKEIITFYKERINLGHDNQHTGNIVKDDEEVRIDNFYRDNIGIKMRGSSLQSKDDVKGNRQKSFCSIDLTAPVPDKCTTNVTHSKKGLKCSGPKRTFSCHFGNCSYSTKLDKDLQRHYRTHTGERPYKCEQCGKTFNRSDKLKIHLRCHAGQKPFQCKFCKYATTDNSSLKKHVRIHTDERPFQCQICPYASRNSSQLIVHLRTHTGDAPFHCNFCSAQFKIKSDLKRHLRVHTGEKPYKCDKCDYRSSNKGNLKTHHKINHSTENEKSCPQCAFVTSSMKRLREHIKIHDEARIVKCSMCQYTCNSSTALRSHMMVHNTLRPFRCTFCPYSSKQSGNLKKHVQNVHNEKHGTVLTSGSTKHYSDKTHTGRKRNRSRGEKPDYQPLRRSSSSRKIHVCNVCGCGFVRHDSLRCHLKQHCEKEMSYKSGIKSSAQPKTKIEHSSVPKSAPPSPPPLPSPPPPPSLPYRKHGLEQIIAAASQLYREQYMNGLEDETLPLPAKTSTGNETNKNNNNSLEDSTVTGHQSVVVMDAAREDMIPVADTTTIEQAASSRESGEDGKVWIAGEKTERGQHASTHSSASFGCKMDGNGQIPWEHSSYTASFNNVKLSHNKPDGAPSKSSSLSSTSSPKPQTDSKSSSYHQEIQLPASKTSELHSLPNTFHHEEVPSSMEALSIQLVPQMASVHPVTSQVSSNSQNLVSNVSFAPHGPDGQPALQILIPAGTQMTQLMPPAQSSSTIQHQAIPQQQIVFQVMNVQDSTTTGQDMVTIPAPMGTPPGGQVILGQCPAYALIQNQVISASTDSSNSDSLHSAAELHRGRLSHRFSPTSPV